MVNNQMPKRRREEDDLEDVVVKLERLETSLSKRKREDGDGLERLKRQRGLASTSTEQ
jgi:hypothetical protein